MLGRPRRGYEQDSNRVWFSLRHNGHTHRGLQAAWNAHGADSFAFEALERIAEEPLDYVRERLLKERLVYWCTRLQAEAI